jgi:RTX calcium-binding nonapeptide repeat (4 copies)
MKKAILILLTILALGAPTIADAKSKTYTVLLAGGEEANMIEVWLAPDGRSYVIDSVVQLEVGGTICSHPDDNPNELVCSAPLIAGFEVNAGGGDDRVAVAKDISIPVTIRGGAGDDSLSGGSGPDKLLGGAGDDRLVGGAGADLLFGGEGKDVLIGGLGSDSLRGGFGEDTLTDGPGKDSVHQALRIH